MDYKIPKHIAIVMDGNGRWAQSRGLARIEGHRSGIDPVKKIIKCCLEKKISCLSLFAFSSENWARPEEEVNFLMQLFIESIKNEVYGLNLKGIRMRFIGDREQLTQPLQEQMRDAEALTQNNSQLIVNVLVNYGGKWDLLNAAKKFTKAVMSGGLDLDTASESDFAQFLDTDGLQEPDLFIRTSGELRISNFYLWQLAYTELYFTEVHWPDFTELEFNLALESFNQRKRRFGQI
ncbi:MAG: di-trans,poly-cis-decaprenylcistransferase [Legionella sp.]|nr:di-trans,poly-cis-decaprenylcistransferase [Legionella sp.]